MNSDIFNKISEASCKLNHELVKSYKTNSFHVLAQETLSKYKEKIALWQSGNTISWLEEFIIGDRADTVSNPGPRGKILEKDFKCFLQDADMYNIISRVLEIRKEGVNYSVFKKLDELDIYGKFTQYGFSKVPHFFLNRFILMTFIEIMSTVAAPKHINTVAQILSIDRSVKYYRLQCQIREYIDEFLLITNQDKYLTEFEKAAIGWWIK